MNVSPLLRRDDCALVSDREERLVILLCGGGRDGKLYRGVVGLWDPWVWVRGVSLKIFYSEPRSVMSWP